MKAEKIIKDIGFIVSWVCFLQLFMGTVYTVAVIQAGQSRMARTQNQYSTKMDNRVNYGLHGATKNV